MVRLIILLTSIFLTNNNQIVNDEYYFNRTNYGIEVIKLSNDSVFEIFGYNNLSPELSIYNYSQGTVKKENGILLFNVSLLDSIELKVIEKKQVGNKGMFFNNAIRILGGTNFISMLEGFDFDNLNHLGHSNEIKLCVVDSLDNIYYQTYNYEFKRFNDVVTQFRPKVIYLSVGSYIVSKKYYIADMSSNCFDIHISSNHLFSNFRRNYLSNHRFKVLEGKIVDLVTKSEYIKFVPSNINKSIDDIAIEKASSK